ncbi:cytochrome c [Methylocystis sp.]|uniref:c-type cytochrome n=1 Tax=Methylocystis sp. TaxID=1911079 RepID=UPI0025E89AEB|nr:cytochrome c [Methylocystis sp.]
MLRFALLAAASCLVLVAGVASAKPTVDAQLLKRGRAIAQQNCGRCHAVGAKGESANPKSPPFRLLARKYPLSNLEEALAEGIVVGHEGMEMPQFRLSAAQIEALLAYLNAIQK